MNLPRQLERFDPIALPDLDRTSIDPSAFSLPALPAYAPKIPVPNPLADRPELRLDARLTSEGEAVPAGLVWRLFAPTPGPDGRLPLVATAKGGAAAFDVPKGSYLMHVGFGYAGVTRRIDFEGGTMHESVVLAAGGLKMNARVAGDAAIAPGKLSFDIYAGGAEEPDRRLVAQGVKPGAVVPLNAGDYRIVSHYGDDNAEVGGEVTVEAGQVTDVTLQHRAASLTMKLVRERGGEAIADTAWQVMNVDGTLVRESVGAFPSMVLAEGDYLVVAKNRDKTFQRGFTVAAGADADVELLTSDVLPASGSVEGSGD